MQVLYLVRGQNSGSWAVIRKGNWVIDADIKGFFDNIDHNWMMKFLEHRISDKRVLLLVEKMLKAGVSDEGTWSASTMGSPQGGLCKVANLSICDSLNLSFISLHNNTKV